MKERQREAATEAILEAAEQVAAERGLAGTSIAAIAKRAGVAVGTLYNYFPDREQLLATWMQHRRNELVPAIEAAALAHVKLPFERRLRAYLADILAIFEKKRQFVRVMASLGPQQQKFNEKKPAVLAAMIASLEEMLRPVAPQLAENYAHMLVGMIRGMAHWRAEADVPLDQDAELLAETFLRGMHVPTPVKRTETAQRSRRSPVRK